MGLWRETREISEEGQADLDEGYGLVPVAEGALFIEDREAAVERMLEMRWAQHLERWGTTTFSAVYADEWKVRERPKIEALLAAAVGGEEKP